MAKTSQARGRRTGMGARRMAEIEAAWEGAPRFEDYQETLDQMVLDEAGGGEGTFEELALEYIALNAQIAEAELRKEAIKKIINPIIEQAGIDKCVTDVWALERVTSHSPKRLDPTKLIMHGVKAEVIEDSYSGGEPYQYTQIRMRAPR